MIKLNKQLHIPELQSKKVIMNSSYLHAHSNSAPMFVKFYKKKRRRNELHPYTYIPLKDFLTTNVLSQKVPTTKYLSFSSSRLVQVQLKKPEKTQLLRPPIYTKIGYIYLRKVYPVILFPAPFDFDSQASRTSGLCAIEAITLLWQVFESRFFFPFSSQRNFQIRTQLAVGT